MTIREYGRSCLARRMLVVAALVVVPSLAWQVRADEIQTPAPEKDPVKIQVSKAMAYDKATKSWVFEGDVKVEYKGDTIAADRITLPDDGRVIKADGHVVLKMDKQELKGESVVYDLDKREGRVSEASAQVTGDGVKGYVFLKGAEASGGSDHYSLVGGHLTTCDLAQPHYHIEAKSIEVWTDDRIVVKGLSYYEGRTRLFYWPYFVFPLKQENTLTFPKVGYSDADGVYVKTSYNYYASPRSNGVLHLDWFQRRGFGTGVDHSFKIPSLKSDGTATLYALGNKVTQNADVTTEIRYHQPLPGGWDSSLAVSGMTTQPKDEVAGLLSLRKKSEKYGGELSTSLRQTSTVSGVSDEIRAVTRQTYALSATASASLDATYIAVTSPLVAGGASVEKDALTYKAEVKDVAPTRTLSVVVEESVNPDRLQTGTTAVGWMNLERLPEATAQFQDIGLPKKLGPVTIPNIGATLTAGRYRETTVVGADPYEAARGDLQVGVRDFGINLSKSLKAELTEMGRVSLYEGGGTRLGVTSGVRLAQRLGDKATARLGYLYEDYVGQTPFAFDAIGKSETVSGGLDAKLGPVSATVGTSYDFRLSPGTAWGDLSTTVSANPSDKAMLSTDVRYNLNTRALRQLSATVKLKPSDAFGVDGTVKYTNSGTGVNVSRPDAFAGSAQWSLGDLRLGYDGQWDSLTQSLVKNDMSVGYHKHCRELRFTYRQSTKALWLEYRLDAFPGADVKVGGSQGTGMVLDVNGLDNLIK